MVNVTLREREIGGNKTSLYLDYYPPIPNPKTGKPSRREYLRLYITTKPKLELDKQRNKEILLKAKIIEGKRQEQLQNEEYGFLDKEKRNGDFIEFFTNLAEKKKGSNSDNWQSTLNHLKAFTGGSLRFREVSEDLCEEFRNFLLTTKSRRSKTATLKKNSAVGYFNKFIASLKEAYKKGYLTKDLGRMISPIKAEETHRQYLTLEELQKLADTSCSNQVLKKAALFSALTALRFSDVEKLTWSEVQTVDTGHQIRFIQKKTKGAETLPISETALKLMGERQSPGEKVFRGLRYSAFTNKQLRNWLLSAGINKNCGFHGFRHTNATLLLASGVDLYVISKLLGHKDLSTTALYTKVVDAKKIEAANKISINIDGVFGK